MSSPLLDGQWRLVYPGTEYTFGTPLTPTFNRTTPDLGDVELRVSDVDRPRRDGRAFGTDFRSGRTVTFELGVRGTTEREARDEAARLTRAWRADPVRSTPGAVAELHTRYAGREVVLFGRPRRFAPDYADTAVNSFVQVVADFAAIDDLFYGPDLMSVTFGISPSLGGGLEAPLVAPLSTTRTSDRSTSLRVDTELPAWPVVRINGPIANPIVTVPGVFEFEVRLDLAYDEHVLIDTQPWAQYALRNGTANVSGAVRGTLLSEASLPSGNHEIGLRGTDPTGTASVVVSWRPAYSSL